MLYACPLGRSEQVHGFGERGGHGFFAVHMLAGGDGPLEELRSQLRGGGVEEDLVRPGDGGVEIGGPALDTMLARELFHLRRITANEQRVGHESRAILERDSA